MNFNVINKIVCRMENGIMPIAVHTVAFSTRWILSVKRFGGTAKTMIHWVIADIHVHTHWHTWMQFRENKNHVKIVSCPSFDCVSKLQDGNPFRNFSDTTTTNAFHVIQSISSFVIALGRIYFQYRKQLYLDHIHSCIKIIRWVLQPLPASIFRDLIFIVIDFNK